jgi:hypothetical protein
MNTEINVLTPNPLMSALRLPGETYRLPSQGLFCREGVLDESVVNGEVEVYPMTTIDEIIISTPDKLLSGKAISEVFQHCIPQIKNAHGLLAKDVDFLMVCLRICSFGPTMDVVYTHQCELPPTSTEDNPERVKEIHSKFRREHTYTVNLQKMIKETKSLDPTTLNQEYTCTLDNGQVVSLNPMTYGNIVELYQNTMLNKTESAVTSAEDALEAEKLIISTIVSVVNNVSGVTNKEHIFEWARALPIGQRKKIQESLAALSEWGIEMKSPQVCKDCGEEITLSVSANPISFFS